MSFYEYSRRELTAFIYTRRALLVPVEEYSRKSDLRYLRDKTIRGMSDLS